MTYLSGYRGLFVVSPYPFGSGGQLLNDNFTELANRVGPYSNNNLRFPNSSDDITSEYNVFSKWNVYNSGYGLSICLDNAEGSAIWFSPAGGYLCVPSGDNTYVGNSYVDFDTYNNYFLGKELRGYCHGQIVYGSERLPIQPYLRDQVDIRGSVQRTVCSVVGEWKTDIHPTGDYIILKIYGGDTTWGNNGQYIGLRRDFDVYPSGYSNKTLLYKLRVVANRTDCHVDDAKSAAWEFQWISAHTNWGGVESQRYGGGIPASVMLSGSYIVGNIADDSGGSWTLSIMKLENNGIYWLPQFRGGDNENVYLHGQLETVEIGSVYTVVSSGAPY